MRRFLEGSGNRSHVWCGNLFPCMLRRGPRDLRYGALFGMCLVWDFSQWDLQRAAKECLSCGCSHVTPDTATVVGAAPWGRGRGGLMKVQVHMYCLTSRSLYKIPANPELFAGNQKKARRHSSGVLPCIVPPHRTALRYCPNNPTCMLYHLVISLPSWADARRTNAPASLFQGD